jgi:hypothetical protein
VAAGLRDEPFHPIYHHRPGPSRLERSVCADTRLRASNRHIRVIELTVDGGPTVSTRQARFEIVSPQGTVQLPANNILGVPPQTATFTAVAWGALVSKLDRGQHTTRFHLRGDGFDATYTTIVEVA